MIPVSSMNTHKYAYTRGGSSVPHMYFTPQVIFQLRHCCLLLHSSISATTISSPVTLIYLCLVSSVFCLLCLYCLLHLTPTAAHHDSPALARPAQRVIVLDPTTVAKFQLPQKALRESRSASATNLASRPITAFDSTLDCLDTLGFVPEYQVNSPVSNNPSLVSSGRSSSAVVSGSED